VAFYQVDQVRGGAVLIHGILSDALAGYTSVHLF
jgi:hypothetical protein